MPSPRHYELLERAFGRRFLWRLGRWLYQGSRRELRNDPEVNGEYGLQGWMTALLAERAVGRAAVICDVGANIGDWAERMAGRLAQAGLTDFVLHCCEPAPDQRRRLEARLQSLIGEGRAAADPRGLGARPGAASFRITGADSGDSALAVGAGADDGGAIAIEVTTLDRLAAERDYAELDLVKVDTEGNDFNVIQGAASLLDAGRIGVLQFEYNWRWVAFHHWLKDVFDFAAARPYALGRLTRDGVELYEAWHPELDRFIETNYVLVRKDLLARLPHWYGEFDASNTADRRSGQARR